MGSKGKLREHRTGRGQKAASRYKPDGVGKVRTKRDDRARVNVKAQLQQERYA